MTIDAIHVLGWFEGQEGYNVHTRNIADALARRITVHRTALPRRAGEVVAVASEVARYPKAGALANLLISWGEKAHYLNDLPGLKIAYVVWETTKLPDSWLEPLRIADRYWVPCAWCREVLIGNGFAPDTVDIVPHGVDPCVFNQGAFREPGIERLDGFKFLTVGVWRHRKGTVDLLKAFDAEFAGDSGARLVLNCDDPHRPDFDLRGELIALNLSCLDQLTFLQGSVHNDAMSRIFTACDVAVFPTRSDPWGLPISEAMACGLPVIATHFGGPADYMNSETGYPLPWRSAPCPWMPVEMADGDYGAWAEPDIGELRRLMRKVYENRSEAQRIGVLAAEHIRSSWTWNHAVDKALLALGTVDDASLDAHNDILGL